MKKKLIYLMVLVSVTLIYGCHKNNPKPGKYVGEFIFTDPSTIDSNIEYYKITETDKNYIKITLSGFYGGVESSPSILYKENKKITGQLPSSMPGSRRVEGTWERKKGKCIIKGTFTQSGASPNGPYTLKGTFELK